MSFDKKDPQFFCDNCGAEVPPKAKNCPGCGRHFSSVRCPSCGFSGDDDSFKSGCPRCGYSAPNHGNKKRGSKKQTTGYSSKPLPFWVYILVAAIFTGIMAILFFPI